MAILSSMINASSCFDPELMDAWEHNHFDLQAARLLSQVRTIAAFSYRKSRGLPFIYPKPRYKYTQNFLHMMFSEPYETAEPNAEAVSALDLIFLLHADHEQNCSTATVRMVASSRANLFASDAAGEAGGGLEPGQPFCQCRGGGVQSVGSAPWGRQPGGD